MKTKFYSFNQNNSGGSFDHIPEQGISATVVIEAHSAHEANGKAEAIGIYFNGCHDGQDCPCCGDRWDEVDEGDGYAVPSLYGRPLEPNYGRWGLPAYVHAIDGSFKKL